MRYCLWLSIFILVISHYSYGQGGCLALAATELEKIYCRVAATPEASRLPGFADFRRNNVQVQALLLKKPAQRLGITLPVNASQPEKVGNASAGKSNKVAEAVEPAKKAAAKIVAIQAPSLVAKQLESPARAQVLANCRLVSEEIRCANRVYRLTHNRQNQQLDAGVLDVSNSLELPPFRGDLADRAAVNRYLADCYQHYIEKMLLIGLGGSTMTYTKFHYTFWELVEQREDFAGRVSAMYDYLKKDKAAMAVKTRYDRDLPGGIDWCMDLSDEVVVCDNGKKNWVYTDDG